MSASTVYSFVLLSYNMGKLEMNDFLNKPADFIMFFVFITPIYWILAAKLGLTFLSSSFSMTMLYLWSRRNPDVVINIMGLIPIQAQYLPWFIAGINVLMGGGFDLG